MLQSSFVIRSSLLIKQTWSLSAAPQGITLVFLINHPKYWIKILQHQGFSIVLFLCHIVHCPLQTREMSYVWNMVFPFRTEEQKTVHSLHFRGKQMTRQQDHSQKVKTVRCRSVNNEGLMGHGKWLSLCIISLHASIISMSGKKERIDGCTIYGGLIELLSIQSLFSRFFERWFLSRFGVCPGSSSCRPGWSGTQRDLEVPACPVLGTIQYHLAVFNFYF